MEVLRAGARMGFVRDVNAGALYILWLPDGRATWAPSVAGLLDQRRKLEGE
jgi:hypothetical protein